MKAAEAGDILRDGEAETMHRYVLELDLPDPEESAEAEIGAFSHDLFKTDGSGGPGSKWDTVNVRNEYHLQKGAIDLVLNSKTLSVLVDDNNFAIKFYEQRDTKKPIPYVQLKVYRVERYTKQFDYKHLEPQTVVILEEASITLIQSAMSQHIVTLTAKTVYQTFDDESEPIKVKRK